MHGFADFQNKNIQIYSTDVHFLQFAVKSVKVNVHFLQS